MGNCNWLSIGTRVQSWGFEYGQDKNINKNDLKFQKTQKFGGAPWRMNLELREALKI